MPKVDSGPIPQRRGVTESHEWENWSAALVKGPIDLLSDALEKRPEVGLVRCNVGLEFSRPDGEHWVLVQIEGSDWVHLAVGADNDVAQRISAWTGRPTMALGYSDFSNFLGFTLYENGEAVVEMGSDGRHFSKDDEDEDDEEVDEMDEMFFGKFAAQPLYSNRHPEGFWRKFRTENALMNALVREQDAYVPIIGAYGDIGEDLTLFTSPEKVQKFILRVDVVALGDPALAFPTPANKALRQAIGNGDPDGVEAALRDGASVAAIAGETELSPLAFAITSARKPDSKRIEVVKLIAERVADVNDGGKEPTAFAPFDFPLASDAAIIALYDALLPLGVDLHRRDARGRTPLHHAVAHRRVPLVQYFHSQGIDPSMMDAEGKTARDLLEPSKLFDEDEHRLREVDAALAAVERGDPPIDGERLRRKVNKAAGVAEAKAKRMGEELKAAFEQLGSAMEKVDDPDATEDDLLEIVANLEAMNMPGRIHVVPLERASTDLPDELEWVGRFGVKEMPDYEMTVGLDPLSRAFVASCAKGDVNWIDVVRFRADGTVLSITNVETHPASHIEVPGRTKVREEGASPERLIEIARADNGEARALSPSDFPQLFAEEYAAEVAARRQRARF